jgi:hypothetical protein
MHLHRYSDTTPIDTQHVPATKGSISHGTNAKWFQ